MGANWDWQVFLRDTGGDETYLQWLLSAWGWTCFVAICSFVVAMTIGTIIGVLRTLPNKFLVFCGDAWTELFRNIPLLVQLFLWYHVIPALFPSLRALSSFTLVVIALGIYTSARISEQVRAGIQSLPSGQKAAGLAMGFSLRQTYQYVLLPMAFRILIPPLTSEAMSIVKNSSVAFAVSVAELTMFALQAQEETSRGVEIYLAVTGLYFVTAIIVNRLMIFLEHRLRIPGALAGGH
ncbi:amino acid ABC transporter permease [Zwartia sp.]|uniref:amino acid ABC transporter permease n=1 Tax=Zwartia sp. TaxID=2978004 RepID=UPI003BAF10CC